ncbi:hypothetical protein ACLOJK_032789 [Asimina triloba]
MQLRSGWCGGMMISLVKWLQTHTFFDYCFIRGLKHDKSTTQSYLRPMWPTGAQSYIIRSMRDWPENMAQEPAAHVTKACGAKSYLGVEGKEGNGSREKGAVKDGTKKGLTEGTVTACGRGTPRKEKSIGVVTRGTTTRWVAGKSSSFSLETPMTPIIVVGGGGRESSSSGDKKKALIEVLNDKAKKAREDLDESKQKCKKSMKDIDVQLAQCRGDLVVGYAQCEAFKLGEYEKAEGEFKDDVVEGPEAGELNAPDEVLAATSEVDSITVKVRVIVEKEISSSSSVVGDSSGTVIVAGSLKPVVNKTL